MAEGSLTLGSEHKMQYTYDIIELYPCNLFVLLTNVTSVILIKNKKNMLRIMRGVFMPKVFQDEIQKTKCLYVCIFNLWLGH